MRYTYDYNGESTSILLERQPDGSIAATIGDRHYVVSASQIANGAWLLHVDGKRHLAYCAADSESRYVHLDGVQYHLEKADKRRRRGSGGAGSGDLTAEMPGQVIDVRVAEGDEVTEGQVLVVLEAMKMEIRITAAQAGIVTKLHVKQGDVVERGQTLAEVKSE